MNSANSDAVVDRIRTTLTDPLGALEMDVEAVELTPAGKRRVLRIAVDKDGGVNLDDVAEATHVVSEALDTSDVMGEMPYTLEVTSRGVDRPLTMPRHWRRNRTRLVKATLADGEQVLGRIVDSTETLVALQVGDDTREVAFEDITKAIVQIEFNRPEGPA